MPGRSKAEAAPPTPWSQGLTGPSIDDSAFIHSFSHIIGDVRIGANVIVAPGTSIRADEGSPFFIGENTNIQDGVVIHGLEQGRVIGDDGEKYSIWVGKNACLTHMALIHGPCYVGDDCFIGFRSTVFNARIGKGCIVMMHSLIQDVEIPPGKYVPSGAVITSQQQADRLPDVQAEDQEFAHHVVGINQALRAGYICAADNKCIAPIRDEIEKSYRSKGNGNGFSFAFERSEEVTGNRGLSADTVEQLRYLFEQGLKIGTEHVDARRFRTGSWQSCRPIEARSLQDAIASLESCLADHSGEYVRLFGIEPKGRKRVLETIIQRPDETNGATATGGFKTPTSTSSYASPSSYSSSSHSNGNGYKSGAISSETADQIRNLLNSGYRIGTEHVDARRFRTGTWQSCQPFESTSVNDVITALEECMGQHQGEYVRLIGIDTKAKRRVLETIIQRPDGVAAPNNGNNGSSSRAAVATSTPAPSNYSSATSYGGGSTSSSSLDNEAIDHIRQLMAGGYKISAEHVDQRRFRTGSWQSCGQIEGRSDRDAIAALEGYMSEYAGEYVRLIGIDPKAKRRVLELIVQRP